MLNRSSPPVDAAHCASRSQNPPSIRQVQAARTTPLGLVQTNSDPSRNKFSVKNRHLVWLLLALVLTHLSQLSAKNDDKLVTWAPPLEPPGSVVVTNRSEETVPTTTRIATQNSQIAAYSNVASSPPAQTQTQTQSQSQASEADLRLALAQWSRAWSQQDISQYLSMYADNFKAPNGISRETWARQRTQRIGSKKRIQHSISDLQIDLRTVTATVRFTQNYQDERLNLTDLKTMFWAFKDGRWQITLETTR